MSATASGAARSRKSSSIASTIISVAGRGMSTSRRHLELEAPEFTHADDVGERLARHAARDQRLVVRRESLRFPRVRVGEEALGRPAEDVLREQPCVEIRFGLGNAGVAEPLPRGRDLYMDAHETAVASLSFSDW